LAERLLRIAGMDIGRPLVWVVVEPTSAPTESRLRRVASLSLQIKGLTVGQFPNAPLALAVVAGLVSASTHGSPHAVARGVAVAATAVWGYLELVHGVNWFRHVLGVYSLVGVVGTLVALLA
jgi:hypothetical protein